MADTTEKTIASELREAAARLRTAGAVASKPPWRREGQAIATGSGMAALAYNGVDATWIELAAPDLAEPLASWLEKTAHIVDSFRLPSHPEHEPCDDPCCYTAHHALAVARVLNGSSP